MTGWSLTLRIPKNKFLDGAIITLDNICNFVPFISVLSLESCECSTWRMVELAWKTYKKTIILVEQKQSFFSSGENPSEALSTSGWWSFSGFGGAIWPNPKRWKPKTYMSSIKGMWHWANIHWMKNAACSDIHSEILWIWWNWTSTSSSLPRNRSLGIFFWEQVSTQKKSWNLSMEGTRVGHEVKGSVWFRRPPMGCEDAKVGAFEPRFFLDLEVWWSRWLSNMGWGSLRSYRELPQSVCWYPLFFWGGYFSSGKIILCWHFVFEGFLGMETKKSDLCGAKAVFFKGWVFEGDLQQEPQDLAHLRSAKCGVLGDPSNNKTRWR